MTTVCRSCHRSDQTFRPGRSVCRECDRARQRDRDRRRARVILRLPQCGRCGLKVWGVVAGRCPLCCLEVAS